MKLSSLLLFAFVSLLFLHCKKEKQQVCTIAEIVSYDQDIQPIFNKNCISCHGGSSPAGNLNLESGNSYEYLVDPKMGYIDTVQPFSSLLYSSMNSTSNPMPPNGKLKNCEIDLVLKWIQQKAKNN